VNKSLSGALRSIAIVGLCTLLAACGSGTPPSTAIPTTAPAAVPTQAAAPTAAPTEPAAQTARALPDPCILMTRAEVNTATGEQFDAGKSTKTLPGLMGAIGTPLNCAYQLGEKQVHLLIFQGTRPYTTQKGFSGFQKTLQAVKSLGDEAFWDTASYSLWTMKGDLGLVVEFAKLDKATAEMGQALLQKALSRMS
jgi:hypothetical protein